MASVADGGDVSDIVVVEGDVVEAAGAGGFSPAVDTATAPVLPVLRADAVSEGELAQAVSMIAAKQPRKKERTEFMTTPRMM